LNLLDRAKKANLYKKLGEWIEKVQSLQMAVDLLTEERHHLRAFLSFKGTIMGIFLRKGMTKNSIHDVQRQTGTLFTYSG